MLKQMCSFLTDTDITQIAHHAIGMRQSVMTEVSDVW